MRRRTRANGWWLGVALLLVGVAAARAEEPAPTPATDEGVAIGEAAPALRGVTWLKTRPTSARNPVSVVYLWGSWCAPSTAWLPDLAQVQTTLGKEGVEVVALAGEPVADLVTWLAEANPATDRARLHALPFGIATDELGSAFKCWLGTETPELPHAFIVGRTGFVEWRGHPVGLAPVLRAVVDGTWNREVAREDRARQAERDVVAGRLLEVAAEAEATKNPDLLIDAMASAIKADPTWRGLRMRHIVLVWAEHRRVEEGRKAAEALFELAWNDPTMLNELAWFIVDDARVLRGKRGPEVAVDLALAGRAAKRAVSLTRERNAAVLDTYARVFFERGELAQAIAWQEKAVAAATNVDMREPLEEVLARYRAAVGG